MFTSFRVQKQLVLNLAGFFCAAVGIILNITQLYLMAAILFLVPLVSFCIGKLLLRGLTCTRSMPQTCHEGQSVVVDLAVRNTGLLPKFYVRAEDTLPRWLEAKEFVSPVILYLMPGDSSHVSYKLEPALRGVYAINNVHIKSTDPLGFSQFNLNIPAKSELTVYPSVLKLRRPVLQETSALGWHGLEAGRARGGGHDFHGIRGYQYGDEVRRVHWPTTARTGKLAVVENAQGTTLNAVVVLDLEAAAYKNTGEGPNSAFETAVKIAATVCSNILDNTQKVRLIAGDSDDIVDEVADSPAMIGPILLALAKVSAGSRRSLANTLADCAATLPSGATVVYITAASDHEDLFRMGAQLEERGVHIFGFGLIAGTFRYEPQIVTVRKKQRVKDQPEPVQPVESDVFLGPGVVQPVRRGDALAQIIEELGSGRK